MAVTLPKFYQRYRVVATMQLLVFQIIVIAIAAGFSWVIWRFVTSDPLVAFVSCLAAFILLEIVAAPLILKQISEPLEVIIQAIRHVSKSGGKTPPPTINTERFERSGLKSVVQSVYELAINGSTEKEEGAASPQQAMLQTMFDNLPCGVAVLNNQHELIYHNSLAPTREGTAGREQLELLFENSDNLNNWLEECEKNKVHETKTWKRIANKLPESEGLKYFDVIAFYNKGNEQGAETILVTIDRSLDYAPDQEDMDFIALAAHELRGPITVIRGYLDVLDDELEPLLKEDQHVLLDRLRVSANRLTGYVNNILNVSRYDRQHLKLHLHEENLMDLLQSLLDDLEMRARTQGRMLGFTVPEDLPTIAADSNSLSEVVSNLVDNAIKYSNEGGQVIVSAGIKGNFIEVTVQDFGIGMPGSVMGSLFSKFYRSHRSRQSVGGTGLGLYISKAIIESHGGSIWVRSTEGQGSTFGFTVPIYSTVAEKLKTADTNEQIIESANGWIRNHAMYRR